MVNDGSSVRFWLARWHGDGLLSSSFPFIFLYNASAEISVSDLTSNNWDVELRRTISPVELEDWQRLTAIFPML